MFEGLTKYPNITIDKVIKDVRVPNCKIVFLPTFARRKLVTKLANKSSKFNITGIILAKEGSTLITMSKP